MGGGYPLTTQCLEAAIDHGERESEREREGEREREKERGREGEGKREGSDRELYGERETWDWVRAGQHGNSIVSRTVLSNVSLGQQGSAKCRVIRGHPPLNSLACVWFMS